jgi:hypothetical protein
LPDTGIALTIHYGPQANDTSVTFTGRPDEVREDLTSYFGIPADTGTTLDELVHEATRTTRASALIVRELDARVLPSQPAPSAPAEPTGDPWEAAQKSASPPQDASSALIARIEQCATTDELRRLWAENQAAFGDEAVMQKWKARGRTLSGT